MKWSKYLLISWLALATFDLRADSTWVYSVQISASVQTTPARVTLQWAPDQYGANNYTVYRKAPGAASWGAGTTLAGSATTYADNTVTPGNAYEYQIVKNASLGYTGYGYICVGVDAPLVDKRGKVVLVVDQTCAQPLTNELARLQADLVGDGWTVARRDVARTDSPATVRQAIVSEYQADPNNVKAVFLFGHVPIMRSGNLNVDGHQARPMPADAYYGDMNGTWNNPSYLPSDVELMVGRVDLWNMPGTRASTAWPNEIEMLRNYLNKDHKWRHKKMTVPRKALVGNRFGDMRGEAFAASGFRNFDPLVGPSTITIANEQDAAPAEQRWTSLLAAGTYLWAYGCGGGSYTSMSFLGTHGSLMDAWSSDLVDQDAKAVFTMMMGSWLGEWDSQDNIMRAMLATPSLGLTCSWAGRPHWYYHHMGIGEPIGYSARLSMNNSDLYRNQVNNFARGVHIALMGDPTLRLHQVAPPSELAGSLATDGARLTWSPAAETVAGYHVYRAGSANGTFTRVTTNLVTGTSYQDSTAVSSTPYTYMVRAVKRETSASGTYMNASQGVTVILTGGGTGGGSETIRARVAPIIGGGMRLTWNSQPGKTYTVLSKNGSVGTAWTTLQTGIPSAGTTTSWTHSGVGKTGMRFYRIQAQ